MPVRFLSDAQQMTGFGAPGPMGVAYLAAEVAGEEGHWLDQLGADFFDLVLIDDDQLRMRLRVERLNSRKAHREYPHSRTNHQVSNVVVGTAEGSGPDAELPVTAAFTVWRFRNGKASYYVGRHHYRFIAVGGELRIRSKRSVLDMTELRPAGDLAIIL